MTVSDFPDFGTPGQNVPGAPQGGVPLLRATDTLGSAAGQVLTSGLSTNLVAAAGVTQPGYEALFSVSLPAGAGTIPFLELIFNWFDSGTALNVDSEFFMLASGNGPGNALQYYINGPVRGNQLTVVAINLDPIQSATVTWAVNQTSHVFEHDRLLQPVYALTAPVTFTNPAGTPAIGLIASVTATIAINSSTTRLLAAFNGKAKMSADNLGTTGGLIVRMEDPGSLYSSNPSARFDAWQVNAGAAIVAEVSFPNGPVLLRLTNQSTTVAITPNVAITKSEY